MSTPAPYFATLGPFAAFLILTSVEGTLREAPGFNTWFPLFYLAKIALVAGGVWWWRRALPPCVWSHVAVAAVAGGLGGVVWIALADARLESALASRLPAWLVPGKRLGYDPFEHLSTLAAWAFLALRGVGLVVVVPVIEEFFWRGFLARFLLADPFHTAPIGRFTPWSFTVVTVLFTLVHPELVAAVVWGAAINLFLLWTRDLGSCIVFHAASNLVLGAYVVASGAWWLL